MRKKKKFSSYILQKLLAINNVQIASLVSPQINIMQTNIMPVKKKNQDISASDIISSRHEYVYWMKNMGTNFVS